MQTTFVNLLPILSDKKYIDLARAKSEALVNNTCKQKKLNRLILKGDDNENGFHQNAFLPMKFVSFVFNTSL